MTKNSIFHIPYLTQIWKIGELGTAASKSHRRLISPSSRNTKSWLPYTGIARFRKYLSVCTRQQKSIFSRTSVSLHQFSSIQRAWSNLLSRVSFSCNSRFIWRPPCTLQKLKSSLTSTRLIRSILESGFTNYNVLEVGFIYCTPVISSDDLMTFCMQIVVSILRSKDNFV